MGICQTVGGASTSGQGISGNEMSFCVRHVISQYAKHKSDGGSANPPAPEDYRARTEFATTFDGKRVVVEDIAPKVFEHLRGIEGITEDYFVSEWELPEGKANTELGEGRSMAHFLKSKSLDFMLKTVGEVEVQALLDVLPQYTKYLDDHPGSFLIRFLMVLKITVAGNVGFVLCFADSFANCDVLNERWDVKGRLPKPGKFNKQSKQGRAEDPANAPPVPENCGTKLCTFKDKDLTRVFWLRHDDHEIILDQLHKDFTMLRDLGLMDYSLLLGVKYNHPTSPIRPDTDAMPFGEVAEARVLSEVRREKHHSASKYHEGIASLRGDETYFIGVIDILTPYNIKKKTANLCKSMLWSPKTLSTIPPPDYFARIDTFMRRIFPKPKPEWKASE